MAAGQRAGEPALGARLADHGAQRTQQDDESERGEREDDQRAGIRARIDDRAPRSTNSWTDACVPTVSEAREDEGGRGQRQCGGRERQREAEQIRRDPDSQIQRDGSGAGAPVHVNNQ